MNIEQLQEKIVSYQKLIADFKIYDENRKEYLKGLLSEVRELQKTIKSTQKDLEKSHKRIEQLEAESARYKKMVDAERDAFCEFLDAYECAPGTVLNPKQKATYFELTKRVTQLKKDNRDLRKQMEDIISQHTHEINLLGKDKKNELYKYLLHCPDDALSAEVLLLRQKVTEKSVAIKELRKWKKEATQFLSQRGLKVEFDKQKSQEYETN